MTMRATSSERHPMIEDPDAQAVQDAPTRWYVLTAGAGVLGRLRRRVAGWWPTVRGPLWHLAGLAVISFMVSTTVNIWWVIVELDHHPTFVERFGAVAVTLTAGKVVLIEVVGVIHKEWARRNRIARRG